MSRSSAARRRAAAQFFRLGRLVRVAEISKNGPARQEARGAAAGAPRIVSAGARLRRRARRLRRVGSVAPSRRHGSRCRRGRVARIVARSNQLGRVGLNRVGSNRAGAIASPPGSAASSSARARSAPNLPLFRSSTATRSTRRCSRGAASRPWSSSRTKTKGWTTRTATKGVHVLFPLHLTLHCVYYLHTYIIYVPPIWRRCSSA